MSLTDLGSKIPQPVLNLCRTLKQHGKRSWVVGGSVRDLLLGRDVHDFDICTDALPDDVCKIFPKVIPTGISHGTVTVVQKGEHYEVTTLRGETTYSDGRHPDSVTFIDDIKADLARRDFTVNAIAFDALENRLVDPFDGQKDLDNKIIRAVGQAQHRFEEDGLRVLRAARFCATLEMTIDPDTESAISRTLDTYRKVSPERIRDEWLKAMKANQPSKAFDVMLRTGILGVTCPELAATADCHHDSMTVFTHSLRCVDHCPKDGILRHAALLHDVAKPRMITSGSGSYDNHEMISAEMSDVILQRLRFSNDERQRVLEVIRYHVMRYESTWSGSLVRRWLKRVTKERLADVIAIATANNRAKNTIPPGTFERIDELNTRANQILTRGDALYTKALAINGNDLIKTLGIKPGKQIGVLLDQLLELVLEKPELNNKESLLTEAQVLVNQSTTTASPSATDSGKSA